MEITFSAGSAVLQGRPQKKTAKSGQLYYSFRAEIGGNIHTCQAFEETSCYRFIEKAHSHLKADDVLVLSGNVVSKTIAKKVETDGGMAEVQDQVCMLKVMNLDCMPYGISRNEDVWFHAGKAEVLSFPVEKTSTRTGKQYLSFQISAGMGTRYSCVLFVESSAFQTVRHLVPELRPGDLVAMSGKLAKKKTIRKELNADGSVTEQRQEYYLLNVVSLGRLATREEILLAKAKKEREEERTQEALPVITDLSAFETAWA